MYIVLQLLDINMVSEAPRGGDRTGLCPTVDQRGAEGTGRHFIAFQPPSEETLRELHVRVYDGVNSSIQLARVELPQAYPFKQIAVDFDSWFKRPHIGGDYPSREAGYNLRVNASLAEPTSIDEKRAREILELLHASTGKGEYSQLPNGTHRIAIPGKDASSPGHTQSWQDGTTVLDLGIDSMERGVLHMLSLLHVKDRFGKDKYSKEYIAERIAKLATESTQFTSGITISLESNQVYGSGVDQGSNGGISGWHKNFSPGENQVLPFLQYSGHLLEAVARGLGGRNLPSVLVHLEVPKQERFFPHAQAIAS